MLFRGQKDRLDYEVRKFRRRRLVKYHDLEQDLLREVILWTLSEEKVTKCVCLTLFKSSSSFNKFFVQELNKRQNQLESAHSMLLRHHEMTQVRISWAWVEWRNSGRMVNSLTRWCRNWRRNSSGPCTGSGRDSSQHSIGLNWATKWVFCYKSLFSRVFVKFMRGLRVRILSALHYLET